MMAKQTPHATKGYYEQIVVPLENRVRELEAENAAIRSAIKRALTLLAAGNPVGAVHQLRGTL